MGATGLLVNEVLVSGHRRGLERSRMSGGQLAWRLLNHTLLAHVLIG